MRDMPRLAWQGGKNAKQSNGGRKNRPGHSIEQAQALKDEHARKALAEIEAHNQKLAGTDPSDPAVLA
jgi:hypothetical protein